MAKLSGINYGTAVPSLGKQSVTGPLGVANAQANTALKKASVAGQVAQNMANIGSIRQGIGDRAAASQLRQIDQQRVFAKDMRSLVGQGADLTVSMIKSNAARGLKDYQTGEAEDYQALLNAPSSVEQPLDPNDPSLGTRAVSTHNSLMPTFQQQQASRKEAILANTFPLARPMMEQLIDEQQSKSVLQMRDAVIKKGEDFTRGEWVIRIDEAIRDKDFKLANDLRKEARPIFSGAKNAQIVGIIERAKKEDEIEGRIFDKYQTIASLSSTERNKTISKERTKEVRDGLISMSDRQDRMVSEAKKLTKEREKENFSSQWLAQKKAVANGDMLASDMTIPETRNMTAYKAAEKDRKDLAEGKLTVNRPEVEQSMWNLAADNPQAFIDSDLTELFGVVGDSELDALKKQQFQMKTKDKGADERNRLTGQVNTSAARSLSSIGISKTENAEDYNALTMLVTKEVEYFEQVNGKKAAQSDIDGIVDRTIKDRYTYKPAFFGGTNEIPSNIEDVDSQLINPLADIMRLRGDQINSITLNTEFQLYKEEIPAIDRAIIKAGQPVTLENRLRMYRKNFE